MHMREPRFRLLPERTLPPYAYLPGKFPHPVRHPLGHSYDPEPAAPFGIAPLDPEAFRWGMDLFNHGFYWEAHEAWEPLWRAADRDSADRALLKGLILMAAAGVKYREAKAVASLRHGRRAAALFRGPAAQPHSSLRCLLGITLESLAAHAEVWRSTTSVEAPDGLDDAVAFPFSLGEIVLREGPPTNCASQFPRMARA